MSKSENLRDAVDAAIAAGHSGRALSLVRQIWFREPSLANAPFVADRMAKITLPTIAVPCQLFVLRSFTVEPLLPLLKASAACWGIEVSARVGSFNAYVQEILDPESRLYSEPTDVAFLAVQTRDIAPELWAQAADLDEATLNAIVDRVLGSYRNWVKVFRSRSQASLVVHNLEQPLQPAAGILDAQAPAGQQTAIARINNGLTALARETQGVYLLDYDSLVARHGRLRWGDEKKWLTVRLPLAATSLSSLVSEWVRFLAPLRGKQAKCLVCDLDNTLWGGVIGEDGMEGIRLGAEFPGAVYTQLQRALLDLTRRGILLAICSKNNEADALEAIDKHPGMLLQRTDFAAMRINWNDKAQNLREIAHELNIGIDSLVFLDDNPVEREFIREMLPEVTVLDVDVDDPFSFATSVANCPLLERLDLSAEDRQRSQIYAQQQQRSALAAAAETVEDYYRSLEMVAEMGTVDALTLGRVAQLTQKTNQLNMTTRRYSEQDIQHFQRNPQNRVFWTRVEDRFGDNGIIGVMIVCREGDDWIIDTFLMSCRVIGRTVETAMLGMLVNQARKLGVRRLVGDFIPTAKNPPAKEIYAKNGFRCLNESSAGSRWVLDLSSSRLTPPEWIDCRILGPDGITA